MFSFFTDTTEVNIYIAYKGLRRIHHHITILITHLQFKTNFCDALLENWRGHDVESLIHNENYRHLPTWSQYAVFVYFVEIKIGVSIVVHTTKLIYVSIAVALRSFIFVHWTALGPEVDVEADALLYEVCLF